ncbi:hypothetical protein BLA29_014208, partial [Euroglyphus maynei]
MNIIQAASASGPNNNGGGGQQSIQLSQMNMSNNFDLPPMIFRSMSDASAIRRNQQMNQSPYNRQQQLLNNLYGTSWATNAAEQQYSHLDLMTIISPENSSSSLSTGS